MDWSARAWPRRRLCLALVGAPLVGCGRTDPRSKLRELPVQLNRPPPSTPTPAPTPLPTPTPTCASPAAQLLTYALDNPPTAASRLISGGVKTSCQTAVDVTVSVRWLDGADRGGEYYAFVTLRRVAPGETRVFKELAPGGTGATQADFLVEIGTPSRTVRPRR